MEIGERLQQLRKENGYSQEQLSELMGVSRQAVCKWETGQSHPDLKNIWKLSSIYQVTTDYIIGGKLSSENQRACEEKIIYRDKKWVQVLKELPRSIRVSLSIMAAAVTVIALAPTLLLLLMELLAFILDGC